jgi:hypothetical protein
MSGMEPIAAVGAVAKMVSKAAEEDQREVDLLRKIADGSGALEPAARALAKRTAVKQQIRLKLWQPLGMLFGVSRNYFANEFEDDMTDRMADIPEEDVITPKLSIAGPAIQGISFTVEEPELKSMYLNLLAKASDRRSQDIAHPSFADVIHQLSAREAVFLAEILGRDSFPIVEIRKNVATPEEPTKNGFVVLAKNVLPFQETNVQVWKEENAVFVDNWARLGLVNVDHQNAYTNKTQYDWVQTNPFYLDAQREYDSETLKVVNFREGILSVTPFGKRFHAVVISSPVSKPAAPDGTDTAPSGDTAQSADLLSH